MQAIMKRLGNENFRLSLMVTGMRCATLGIKFILTIFIAHSMGLEALGLYGLISGITIMAPTLASMGLMTLIARELVTHPLPELTRTMRHYWRVNGLVYAGLIIPVAVAVAVYLNQPWLVGATLVLSLLEHINSDCFSLLINRKRPILANVLFFIRAGGWMFLFIALAWFWPEFATITALIWFWFVALIICLTGFVVATREWPWKPEGGHETLVETKVWFVERARKTVQFWGSDLGNSAGQYIDRYIVTAFLGLQFTGVYVLYWSVVNAIYNLVNTGTLQINRPHLIDAAHRKDAADFWKVFRLMARNALLSAIGFSLAAAVVFPLIVPYLNRPLASQFVPVLWVLLFATVLRSGFDLLANYLYARRMDTPLIVTNISVLPVSIVMNLLLLPVLGIYGAALGAVLTQLIVTAVRLIIAKKTFNKEIGS
jgi:O-antigen/teichoic acid export membrane protein